MSKISIIGSGNLGKAIALGLLSSKTCKASQLILTKRQTSGIDDLAKLGLTVSNNNVKAVKEATVIILCVKPFQAKEVLNEISKSLTSKHLLISCVSGVSISEISSFIKNKCAVARAMPNTAISIKESMTCISYNSLSEQQVTQILDLFNSLGNSVVIDEKLMDAATVLGACGTAFALRYIRANIQAGIEIGFDAKTAHAIASQTVMGAAKLLLVNHSHPEQEIDKVTTPKGITITGLNQMEHHGLSSSVIKGITESYKKFEKN